MSEYFSADEMRKVEIYFFGLESRAETSWYQVIKMNEFQEFEKQITRNTRETLLGRNQKKMLTQPKVNVCVLFREITGMRHLRRVR